MKSRITIALRLSLVTLLITGVLYPLAVTALSQVLFPKQANGSLIYGADGQVLGSTLIGQAFGSDAYFHPRPSANDYDGTRSGASNLGPTSARLEAVVKGRVQEVRDRESLGSDDSVPVDLVTASASGLDPHITPEAARVQAPRVAAERGVSVDTVITLIEDSTEHATLGYIGSSRVNVLALNLALDHAYADR